eukprot:TRINITY_DN15613_c0_g3_i2.p1 TRINITY_DN15613_c0_g3~~TRINITY_DN15613_c0_g3_i2.p1  ORF type:complete len:997 (-),score=119.88 TRINITY_DN15613_c0_g3_i2:166-3156(-)
MAGVDVDLHNVSRKEFVVAGSSDDKLSWECPPQASTEDVVWEFVFDGDIEPHLDDSWANAPIAPNQGFDTWECVDDAPEMVSLASSQTTVKKIVWGLRDLMVELCLEDYVHQAEAWAAEMGAVWLEEVIENAEDFADALRLKVLERRRLQRQGEQICSRLIQCRRNSVCNGQQNQLDLSEVEQRTQARGHVGARLSAPSVAVQEDQVMHRQLSASTRPDVCATSESLPEVDSGYVQACVAVPQWAMALVVGKRWRNIAEMERCRGIVSIKLSVNSDETNECAISGTSAKSVGLVASRIEKLVSLAMADSGKDRRDVLLDFESDCAVRLIEATRLGLFVDLENYDSAPGRIYFGLSHGARLSVEEMKCLQREWRPWLGSDPSCLIGLVAENYESTLQDVLRDVRQMHTGRRLRVEARFGCLLFAHPPGLLSKGRDIPVQSLSKLRLHRDLDVQFFVTLRRDVAGSIKRNLISKGFMPIPAEEVTVVHLIDCESQKRISVTLAECENGMDSRLEDEKKSEIDRIASSSEYYEVLGVRRKCSDVEIVMGFYRISKLIHPKCCAHPGAQEAWNVANLCKDTLINEDKRRSYDDNPLPPPAFTRSKPAEGLRVIKCHGNDQKHWCLDVARSANDIGMRVVVRSYEDEVQDHEMLKWFEEAWQKRSDGLITLKSGARFRIDTIRYKTKYRFIDSRLKISVEHVRQIDVECCPAERWEVEVRSLHVKRSFRSLMRSQTPHTASTHQSSGDPSSCSDEVSRATEVFNDFMQELNVLSNTFMENVVLTPVDHDYLHEEGGAFVEGSSLLPGSEKSKIQVIADVELPSVRALEESVLNRFEAKRYYDIDPFSVAFSHGTLSSVFRNGSSVDDTIASIFRRALEPREFPPLDVIIRDGQLVAIRGNRRLFLFRVLAAVGAASTVRILIHSLDSPIVQSMRWDPRLGRVAPKWERSLSSDNNGRWVDVRSRYMYWQCGLSGQLKDEALALLREQGFDELCKRDADVRR